MLIGPFPTGSASATPPGAGAVIAADLLRLYGTLAVGNKRWADLTCGSVPLMFALRDKGR